MTKPNEQNEPNELTLAILELRRLSGLSQQYLATALRMSTRALSTYENGVRTPGTKQLLALAAFADGLNSDQLFQIFTSALMAELEPPPGWEVSVDFRRTPPNVKARREAITKKVAVTATERGKTR